MDGERPDRGEDLTDGMRPHPHSGEYVLFSRAGNPRWRLTLPGGGPIVRGSCTVSWTGVWLVRGRTRSAIDLNDMLIDIFERAAQTSHGGKSTDQGGKFGRTDIV